MFYVKSQQQCYLNDALKLDKLSKKNKVMFGIAFQNRFNKSVVTLKKLS